ncbi:MAG: hypothetical protein IKO15_06450 [Clostridiales bacterium]|jgi:hypothetical protein|nr:hypothetical protein [Clostridiales bacterium]
MRKITAAALALFIFMISITACSNPQSTGNGAETPVTVEQENTEGKLVARAYIESLFWENQALFEGCYPEGFLDRLNSAAGVNVFDEYKKVFKVSGTFLGTASLDYRDLTLMNGYDEAYMRSRISTLANLDYSAIELMQIQKVQIVFEYEGQILHTDFYVLVYEVSGKWYVLETVNADVGF